MINGNGQSRHNSRDILEADVHLTRQSCDVPLGVTLVPSGSVLVLARLPSGLMAEWNAQRPNGERILQIGDWVVEVNGCRGDPSKMLRRFQEDTTFAIVVRFFEASVKGDFEVRLGRSVPFEPLGLDFDVYQRVALRVKRVQAKGLLAMWNLNAPEAAQVRRGDHIVDVNGVSANSESLLVALGFHVALVITLRRPVGVDSSVDEVKGENLPKVPRSAETAMRLPTDQVASVPQPSELDTQQGTGQATPESLLHGATRTKPATIVGDAAAAAAGRTRWGLSGLECCCACKVNEEEDDTSFWGAVRSRLAPYLQLRPEEEEVIDIYVTKKD